MDTVPELRTSVRTPNQSWAVASLLVFAGWMPAAFMAAYLRWTVLNANGGGFEFVAESLHISAGALAWYQKLALFRGDLLVAGLLAPAVLLLATQPLASLGKARVTLVVGLLFQLLLFVELKVFWEVGAFLPLAVLITGVTAVGREFVKEYTKWSSLLKFIVLVCGTLILYHLALRWERQAANGQRAIRLLAVVGWGGLVILTALAWAIRVPPSPYQSSALVAVLRASSGVSGSASPRLHMPIERDSLLQAYRSLTNAPVPNGRTSYTGLAKGNDVLFLVLETAPSACVDVNSLEALPPTMRSLAGHSFLGLAHYTTYPFTERAIFSIFSGWYPSNNPVSFVKMLDPDFPELLAPGVARSALNAGYSTAIFAPEPVENWVHEDVAFRAMGFTRWFVPPPPNPETDTAWTSMSRRERAFVRDTLTLTLLKRQISAAVHANHRYLFSYLPQYTHGPWPDLTPESSAVDVIADCRPLFTVVDRWLGEITTLLRDLGTLDRTLIVVVGDHGLRTREEHPSFVAGSLGDISFHVPLLIYAPSVLDSTVRIPWLTSHIDLAPSILDLLGLESERGLEQGSPLWSAGLQGRKTFFFARNYLGADGYYGSATACMYKYAIETAACAPWTGKLHFSLTDFGLGNTGLTDSVRSGIGLMTALQDRWAQVMIPANYRRVLRVQAAGERIDSTHSSGQ